MTADPTTRPVRSPSSNAPRPKSELDARPMKGDHPGEIPNIQPMNALGRKLRVNLLDQRHIPYRASAATNSITLYNPLNWVTLVAEFARNAGVAVVPVSIREGDAELGPEVAFMLRDGGDSVRIRVGDDAAKLVRRFGASAIKTQAGNSFWDTGAPLDLVAMAMALRDLGDLPEPD